MKTAQFFLTLNSENLTHLSQRAKVSRQSLHSALKTRNMRLENLSAVAKAMQLEVEFIPVRTEKNLLGSLARFGVPVAHSKEGTLSLDEAVQESLLRAREDGAYETFVPYLLARNAARLNPLKLAARSFESDQVNALGYFTELANAFRPHANLEKLLRLLEAAKSEEKEFLVRTSRTNFPELFEKNHLALKWNLKVRGTVQDHLQRWDKWARSPKSI